MSGSASQTSAPLLSVSFEGLDAAKPVSDPALDRIAAYLTDRFGLTFADHAQVNLARVAAAAAKQFGFGSLANLALQIESPEAERAAVPWLIRELTVGETYFFRVSEQFAALREIVAPDVARNCVSTGQALVRAWSAGCASGEEAYSIGIALAETLPGFQISVLGTDINRSFLARAEKAEYSTWSLRGVSESDRERYFDWPTPASASLKPELRRLARFGYLNLNDACFPDLLTGTAGLDVIFCRNVFIYHDTQRVAQLAQQLSTCLRDGGYLFFGPSDPVPAQLPGMKPVACAASMVFQRTGAESERPKPPSKAVAKSRLIEKRAPLPARPPRRPEPTSVPAAPPAFRKADIAERALSLANRGDLSGAQDLAEEWLAKDATDAPACHLLALIHKEKRNPRLAMRYVRRAVYLDPNFALAHYEMAELLAAENRRAQALGCFENALALLERLDADAVLAGSTEIRAGWLTRVIRTRMKSLDETSELEELAP